MRMPVSALARREMIDLQRDGSEYPSGNGDKYAAQAADDPGGGVMIVWAKPRLNDTAGAWVLLMVGT